MLKKLIFLLLVIPSLLFAGTIQEMQRAVIGADIGGGGVPCTGSIATGSNESFESGAGAFCTTGITEVDVDGVVDTYSAAFAHTGTHSLKVVCDGDNANEPDNRIYADMGGVYNDIYFRFYVWPGTLASGAFQRNFITHSANNATTGALAIQWFNSSGTYHWELRNSSATSSEYFNLTPGAKYRVEMHVIKNSTSTMRVYDSGDNILTASGGSNTEITLAANNFDMQYIIIKDNINSTVESTYYVDDLKIDRTGTDWIGAE